MKNQKTIQKIAKTQKLLRKAKLVLTVMAVTMTALTGTVFAADPLSTINSLSDFIFSAIKAIGFILLGFGVVQIGLSLKSHDASQRANGFLTFFLIENLPDTKTKHCICEGYTRYDIIERKKYINLPLNFLFYIDNAHILWYNEYTK